MSFTWSRIVQESQCILSGKLSPIHYLNNSGLIIYLTSTPCHHLKCATCKATVLYGKKCHIAKMNKFHNTYYFKRGIMKKWLFIISHLVLLYLATSANAAEVNKGMKLTSPSFKNQEVISKKFTCDGENISPALEWSSVPKETKSFVLIVDDPDAPDPKNPSIIWVHWVLYNIPATVNSLPEGKKDKNLPDGTLQGLNDWKRTGYGGPCPPIGQHRFFSSFMH